MTDLWADISGFQECPDVAWFVALKQAGYVGVYVQLWGLTPKGNRGNEYAMCVLARARGAALLTGGYVVLYPSSNPVTNVDVGVAMAGVEAQYMRFVAIDLESTTPMEMSKVVVARVRLRDTYGFKPAIYTSRRTWMLMFGTTYPFLDPLIEARYFLPSGNCPATPPDIDWAWNPFGGWSSRAMLQYGGTCETAGVGADRNVADAVRMGYNVPEPEPKEVSDMFLMETVDLAQNKWYVVGATGKRHVDDDYELEIYQRDPMVYRTQVLSWQADQIPDQPTGGAGGCTCPSADAIANAVADKLDVKVD